MSQELVKQLITELSERAKFIFLGEGGGSHAVFADNDSTSIDLVGFSAAWVVLVDDIPARYRLQ